MFEVSLESMDTGICLSRSPELFVNSEYSSGDRYRRDCKILLFIQVVTVVVCPESKPILALICHGEREVAREEEGGER